SVVLINYADKAGQGTGFLVPGKNKEVCTVLTARHVVPPSAKLQLQTNDQKIWEVADIKRFAQQDLAVVIFKPDNGTCLYKALPLGNSDKVSLGDNIYITGFPGNSLAKQFTVGTVSSIDSQTDGYGISYSATTAGGMSGGPVMNVVGEVIAVHGRTELELTRQAELKGESPPPQQQSTTIANSQPGDAVGTFKWGIPINTYMVNVSKILTEAEATQKSQDFLNEGNDYFVKDKYEQAIASYDKAIAIKPDYYEALLYRGSALNYLQRYSEAIASDDKAIAIKPNYQEVWYNRGISLVNLQRYSEAIASYDKAIAIKPDYHEAWHGRGISLERLQRYSEAFASYDKAITIQPDYHEAWHGRGVSLERLQRYTEAIASYDKAVAIKADKYEAWTARGVSLWYLKQYDEALKSYDKAISIKPDYQIAIDNRKSLLEQLGRSN
ncbi:tetratricopeptide repeat protein, partial [Nostoc sp. CALU 546]